MDDVGADTKYGDERERATFGAFVASFSPSARGNLAFNLSALAWIVLNIDWVGRPVYLPGAYLHPELWHWAAAGVLIYGVSLSWGAIRSGVLFPALLAPTFLWALVCTLIRSMSY